MFKKQRIRYTRQCTSVPLENVIYICPTTILDLPLFGTKQMAAFLVPVPGSKEDANDALYSSLCVGAFVTQF